MSVYIFSFFKLFLCRPNLAFRIVSIQISQGTTTYHRSNSSTVSTNHKKRMIEAAWLSSEDGQMAECARPKVDVAKWIWNHITTNNLQCRRPHPSTFTIGIQLIQKLVGLNFFYIFLYSKLLHSPPSSHSLLLFFAGCYACSNI